MRYSSRSIVQRLGKPSLRGASTELIVDCFGAEQWSEHFTSSHAEFQLRLSSVCLSAMLHLLAEAPICSLLYAAQAA